MAHLPRRSRLNSLSDSSSTPSCDISEGSEFSGQDWQIDSQNSHSLIVDNLDLQFDNLSLDTNSPIPEVTDNERAQIESFFSGLGTEVSALFKLKFVSDCSFLNEKTIRIRRIII